MSFPNIFCHKIEDHLTISLKFFSDHIYKTFGLLKSLDHYIYPARPLLILIKGVIWTP